MSASLDGAYETFQRDGVVLLRGAFGREWLDLIAAGIERNMLEPSERGGYADGATKGFFQDTDNWQRIEEFRRLAFESPAKDIAAAVLGATKINFVHDHVLVKKPGAAKRTVWHQDQPYSPIDGWAFCTMWIPIDPVSRETSLEFVKGSHRWGKWFRPQRFATGELRDEDDKTWELLPDIEANRASYDIVRWAMEPGDCLVFHALTLHGASGNAQTRPRRVLSTRWTGDDAVFKRRTGEMSPPVPAVGAPEDGAPLDSPTFPVVWRADKAA